MKKIDDITLHKIKYDQELIKDYDPNNPSITLFKKLVDKDFHNNLFLGSIILEDEIRNAPIGTEKRNELRLDRIELNNNYAEIIGERLEDLQKYYSSIVREFADDNNGELINDYICDAEYAMQFELMNRKYRDSDEFKYILTKMMIDAENGPYLIGEQGIRSYWINLQENIKQLQNAFPDFPMDYRDATIMYGRLNFHLQELMYIVNTLGLVATHEEERLPDNSHRALSIETRSFMKLLKDFDNTYHSIVDDSDDEKEFFIVKQTYSKFLSLLRPYKTRCEYAPTNRFTLTTRELENILIDLIQYCSYNIEDFIQFLLDNKIRLPLSIYKSCLIPTFLLEFENSTVQKAFILEGEKKMYDMDQMRKDCLSASEYNEIMKKLIKLRPKSVSVR